MNALHVRTYNSTEVAIIIVTMGHSDWRCLQFPHSFLPCGGVFLTLNGRLDPLPLNCYVDEPMQWCKGGEREREFFKTRGKATTRGRGRIQWARHQGAVAIRTHRKGNINISYTVYVYVRRYMAVLLLSRSGKEDSSRRRRVSLTHARTTYCELPPRVVFFLLAADSFLAIQREEK